MKDAFGNRKYMIMAIMVIATLVLLVRLFIIQIVKDTYRLSADNNVLRYVTQYPARGLIYDRYGKLMVSNQAAYDLMVVPAQTSVMDTAAFCRDLEISIEYFRERIRAAIRYQRRAPSVFLKQISVETYARFQEKLFNYPGFYVQSRTLRKYAKPVASHLVGYVSEVDDNIIKKNPYYKSGDYIGKLGIEEAYEKELRGKRGVKIFMVDVFSRVKGSYANGLMDTVAVQGADIISGIDLELQEYGELLMQNKIGSIVAIEPSTGEILTLVSSPGYDPALLVGRERTDNFSKLLSDTILQPLFNRACMASYPPGSTFKPINGLIGLQERVIVPSTLFGCDNGYLFVGCHSHDSPLNLKEAIAQSCNSYFCQTYRRLLENSKNVSVAASFDVWRNYLIQFGFGRRLGSDLSNELNGIIVNTSYFDKYYGEGRWKALTIISMAIGQGEIGTTPLQMANMTAAIANRGYWYTPHIVKEVGEGGKPYPQYNLKHIISIDTANFEAIIDGMDLAVNGGDGSTARVAAIKDIVVCGKTGTAQNAQRDGDDHSVFVAFAPKDNPKIAIAVYVENAGYGSTYAAPVASLMIEKYLKREITNKYQEQRMLELNLIDKLTKVEEER